MERNLVLEVSPRMAKLSGLSLSSDLIKTKLCLRYVFFCNGFDVFVIRCGHSQASI